VYSSACVALVRKKREGRELQDDYFLGEIEF